MHVVHLDKVPKEEIMRTAKTAILVLLALVAVAGAAFGGAEAEEPQGEGVVVEYWARDFDESQAEWREAWVEAFHETRPDIQVNLTLVSSGAWDEKMTGAKAVGETPDIVHYAYNHIIPRASNGELLPIEDYVDPAVIDDLYDNVREMITWDGRVYAYPELVEPSMVLYYNKDMFVAAGLDPDAPPQSWDELLEYAEALTTEDHYGLIIPATAVELGWTLWGMRYGVVGHRLISEDWSESLADDPGYLDLAAFWASLYEEEVVPKQSLAPYVDIAPFANQQAAMSFGGSWSAGAIKQNWPDLVPSIGVSNVPTQDGDYRSATASLGGWNLAIDGLSENPQAAADFIAWNLGGNPEIMVEFFKSTGLSKFSARRSVDDALLRDPEATADPFMSVIAERVVPFAVAETAYPFDINIAFGNALERVYIEGMDIRESFEIAHREIQGIIENQGIAGTNPSLQ